MQKTKQNNYERASQLLGKLFEVDSDIVEQINTGIRHNGIRGFFKTLMPMILQARYTIS